MLIWSTAGLAEKEAAVLQERLRLLDVPSSAVRASCEGWLDEGANQFLRRASWSCLQPGCVVPGSLLLKYLPMTDPFPSSVLRRAAELSEQLCLAL